LPTSRRTTSTTPYGWRGRWRWPRRPAAWTIRTPSCACDRAARNDLAVTFYKVDDLAGTIGGVAPGQAGYVEAMSTRLYQLSSGGALMNGPGYGNFAQAELLHVNAGDMIAMAIANMTTDNNFFAFSQANPDGTGHLWNYGLNTWGWEDQYGGGDHDYNDLVVVLDFTSHAGHGLLV
jgi:hypothetical protein